MAVKIPMTKNGAELLRAELDRLKGKERPRVIQAIADAREHGDLKENAEYHAAREEQGRSRMMPSTFLPRRSSSSFLTSRLVLR